MSVLGVYCLVFPQRHPNLLKATIIRNITFAKVKSYEVSIYLYKKLISFVIG